ncbi:DUF418 domain-containing protein [Cytophagaceae bacterium ABcell3]|nr:DUF418 domain-containing protein [Cytophagaceae bacterium ABcell3]
MTIQQSAGNGMRPLGEKSRMHVLDALRGFSILGILLVNLFYLSGYKYFSPESFGSAELDEKVLFYVNFLALGKFYSLFSFLFGLGFAIQLDRTSQKGLPFLPLYFRRLGVLFVIGLLHTLVWQGDILTVYSLAAILLIPFKKANNKTILGFSVALLISPAFLELAMNQLSINPGQSLYSLGHRIKQSWDLPTSSTIVTEGGLYTYLLAKVPDTLLRYAEILSGSRFPKLWGMFLLGLYFGRNNLFADIKKNAKVFKFLLLFGGLGGLVFTYFYFMFSWPAGSENLHFFKTLARSLGEHPLALGYMAGFSLLYAKKQAVLDWMAPAGRMALTNYLMQSIISVLFFYNIGLGLGPVGPAYYVPFAFVFFLFQVLYSHWWLKFFKYGPVEYLWRSCIYGKLQRFRK